MKKRLLAMLLALMLVVGLLPVGVLAADGDTVNRIRLMDKNAWGLAAIEKAGYSNEDVLWSNITSIRFFASDGSYTNWGVASEAVPDCYSHEGYLATDAGTKIIPSNINRIVVKVDFAYKGLDAFDPEYGVTAVFHSADFELDYTEGSAGVREYAEFTLKSDQSYEKDCSVTFYFQPIGSTQWELYDIVYVNAGETLGSNMPADPNYGTQDFVSWQTQTDGGGDTLTSTTVINKDWVVYGTKTTAGGATAYHVMRDSTSCRYNALQDEVADAYNAENGTSYTSGNVQISNIRVNGIGGEHTNPIYHSNRWNDDASHYYIYNLDAYAAESQPQYRNTRIPVSEVTGITLTGIIDGNSFSVTIPKDELALQEISNPVTSDTIIEIRVRDKLDGITKELVESAEDAPAGVTGVSYPVDGKVTIPEDGSVTLLYKITVTGDQNAEYIVTDENATAVSGSLTGTLGTNGVAVIYVTKTFSADDVVDGVLTNSASLSNNNTTLPPDDGNDEDEAEVDAEVGDEGGEEPGPEPVAKLDVDKTVAIPGGKDTAAVGDKLEYTVTITSLNSVAATGVKVTDTMWESGSSVKIDGKLQPVTADEDGCYVTVDVPADDTVVIYYTYTVPETDAGNSVGNAVTVGEMTATTSTPVDEAEEPEQPTMYKIYVTVHNGTATFYGSEVETYILAVEGEDITITFTPDEGYTLDYATIDGNTLQIPDGGVYTLKLVDSDHTIEVFYAEDELGGGEDGNEPDGTPDYRQVFVKYVAADENGFVTPSFDTFNLEVDENGKVMTNVALSLKGEATPNADATFAYWTIEGLGYDGGAYSYEADLSGKDFTGYVAGQTYTFTAYFNGPVVKPEQVPYNINVEVVNGTAEFKGTNIGANSVINVYPIEDDNKNVTITFVPEDGFVFDAAYVGNEPVDLKDNSYTFGEVTADVTIKVLFKQDSVPITPVTPMPTPGEISDLIKDSITVDCVNGEVAHAEKVYGLLDGSLVNVEKTDDTSIKVTLDATVYQARYNTDTETKHSLADGQSATVTFALNYVDQTWRVAEGELPITIKVVCETPVSPAVPEKPSYSDIASLFRSSIQVDCVSKSYHKTGVYGLLTDGYTVSAPVKGSDGKYTCTVTLLANAYLAKYNNSFGYAKHSLASYQGNESVTLKWNEAEEEWNTVYGQLPVTIDVVCKNYIPVLPSLPDVPDDTTPNWLNLDDHDAYIQGYPDGRVKPQNNITRAEVATIFFRLLTDDARDYYYSTDSGFSDVNPGDWYNTAVATMVQAGILNGYSDGTFKPNASITRAEFATIAARFLSNPYSTKDRFYDTEGHWAEVYINRAAEIGWIGGYPDGSFKPDRYITRAEAVTLVNNVLGRANPTPTTCSTT